MGAGGMDSNGGCCGVTAKYMILLLNSFVLLGGFILLIMGIVLLARDDFSMLDEFDGDGYHGAGVVIIIFALLVMGMAFMGCYGAMREHRCLMASYASVLILVLICIFSASIAAFVFAADAEELVEEAMLSKIKDYKDESDAKKLWDTLQEEGECCGIRGPADWYEKGDPPFANGTAPVSCCKNKPDEGVTFCTIDGEHNFKNGCLSKYIDDLKKISKGLGWVGLLFSFFLVAVIFVSCKARSSMY